MIGKRKIIDFTNFEKVALIKKYEYFHINKVFSEVYLIKNKETGKFYVGNMTHPEELHENRKSTQRLINLFSSLDHPAILKMVGFSKLNRGNKSQSVIITEYHYKGTLSDMIQMEREGHPYEGWNDTKKLINIYGIAAGLLYLHSKNILHRDIRPSKILLDNSLHPIIRGLHLMVSCDDLSSQKAIKSSPEYMAPEIIMHEPSNKPMDVYSFAMTVNEILSLRRPFEEMKDPNVVKVLQKVGSGNMPIFDDSIPLSFKKLIESCWSKDPSQRPTFEEIVHSLKSDPGFLTENVDKEEYFNYINQIDQYSIENKENVLSTLLDEEEKHLREQIHLKTEENLILRNEIEKLKKHLNDEKEKLRKVIQQKEKKSPLNNM